MPGRDLASNAKCLLALSPGVFATGVSLDGEVIDTLGFRWAYFVVNTGTLAVVVTTLNVVSDELIAMGSPTAVVGADFSVAGVGITAADDDTVFVGQIDCHKTERFLRLEGVNGAGNNDLGAVVILVGDADTINYPVTPSAFSV